MIWVFRDANAFTDQNLSSWNVDNVQRHNNFIMHTGGGNTEPKWK
jgi:hypothetical protein